MNLDRIKKSINTILTDEAHGPLIDWINNKSDGSQQIFDADLASGPDLKLKSDHSLHSPNYALLMSLYSRLGSDEEKQFFINELEVASNSHDAAILAFLFLLKQIGIERAIKLLDANEIVFIPSFPYDPLALTPQLNCFQFLNIYLLHEYESVSEEDLDAIDVLDEAILKLPIRQIRRGSVVVYEDAKQANRVRYAKQVAEDMQVIVNNIRHKRLSDELLEGINLEINQDRDEVVNHLEAFGFPTELIESLRFVENEYNTAETPFNYKTCASHLRSFLSGFTEQIADKVAVHHREDRCEEPAKYLSEKSFFNSNYESDLFRSFINYLSSDSVHQLSNDREVARIGKNVAIEFALLLSKRLEKYLEEIPQ